MKRIHNDDFGFLMIERGVGHGATPRTVIKGPADFQWILNGLLKSWETGRIGRGVSPEFPQT